jgi:hypothetical protein
MKYISLRRAAKESVEALSDFINGDKYKGVDPAQFMREIRDILKSGIKHYDAVREKGE